MSNNPKEQLKSDVLSLTLPSEKFPHGVTQLKIAQILGVSRSNVYSVQRQLVVEGKLKRDVDTKHLLKDIPAKDIREYSDVKKPEVKARKNAYRKKPEVKARQIIYQKRYHQDPEVKKRIKGYQKQYSQKAEVKLRNKLRRQNPDHKARMREYHRKYDLREEVKARKKELSQTPEYKQKQKEYLGRPEIKKQTLNCEINYEDKIQIIKHA